MSGFGLDNLPYGVVGGRCVVRYGDQRPAARAVDPLFAGPTLNPFLAAGRAVWEADARARSPRCLESGNADLLPLGAAAAADRDRRLRRLLLLDRARDEHRAALPPRRRAAAAQLPPPADRLPRPRGLDRRLRARRSPARTASGRSSGRREELDVEVELGFVTGPGKPLGTPIAPREAARPRLRLRARQRLERARPAALGVPAARPVPGEVVRDLDLALDRPAGGARALSRPGARAGPGAAARTCGREGDWALDVALELELNGAVDQPHERARPLLDVPAAARPRDRQRRGRAARRPVRQRHDLRRRRRAARAR